MGHVASDSGLGSVLGLGLVRWCIYGMGMNIGCEYGLWIMITDGHEWTIRM